jgi:TonB-linked SusC/RagA family outer membrane protein
MQFGRTPHVQASTTRRATLGRWTWRMAAAIASLVGAQTASAQAAGVISGRVTDAASGQPVGAVNVTVVGSTNGALTGDDGRYMVRQVPAGSVTLNFARIGYESQRITVTVTDGTPVTGDVVLKTAVLSLQTFVTTVTGPTRKIELGTTTAQINVADKIAELPVNSMGTLLSGRAAGVQVLSAGAPGAGSRIRIRGQNSLSLSNEPLVYVDGVRVTSGTTTGSAGASGSLATNSTGPSRFDDLSPDEIESIEIVKGPSAATLYGTEAANGVINITTKRGKSGKTVWQFFTENGLVQDPVKGHYPQQYYRWGSTRNSAGAVAVNQACYLTAVAAGVCFQQDSLTENNLLNADSTSFIDNGHRNNYGMQVSGGSDRVQFFLAGEMQDENGTYRMTDREQNRLKAERGVTSLPDWQTRPNTLSRINLRGNLSATIATGLTAQLSTAYITSELNRPSNENSQTGLMVSALGGPGGNKYNQDVARKIPLYGGFTFPHGDIMSQRNTQNLDRYINSLALRWQALSWLSARGTAGLDYTSLESKTGTLLDQGPTGVNRPLGNIGQTRNSTALYSLDLGATATWQINSRFQSKTSTGVQYFRTVNSNLAASANTLPPGGVTISSGAIRAATEGTSETITLGTYIEQQIGINDRLFLVGAMRFDDNSAFGSGFNGARYPKVSGSWAISEEPWFKMPTFVQSVRVRSAYGASGVAPGTNDALRYFSPSNVTLANGVIGSGATLAAVGNPNLKQEQSTEFEGGFDLGLFNGATNFEVTYYSKITKDALIQRDIAPSTSGIAQRFDNIGKVKNAGTEIQINQRILDNRFAAFNLTVTGSGSRNRLVTLGEGVTPIFSGNRTNQRNTTGYPLFGIWQRTYTINDRNGDGIVAGPTAATSTTPADPGDLILSDSLQYIGNTFPKFEVAVSPSIELLNRKLRINAQIDSRQGLKKFNNTLRHQCQGGDSCRGKFDPSASLEQQAAAVAMNNYNGIYTGFIEDGSFTRFRELSVAYELPQRLARSVRATRLNVILTGRNLAVWTKYSGTDPESVTSNSDDTGNEEYFSTPPLRTFTFRLNFTF